VHATASALAILDFVQVLCAPRASEARRHLLMAADAAVQLRKYGVGQTSPELCDCVAAGVPSVTNENLGAACDSPAYVVRVPNIHSPLLVAEALANLHESGGSMYSGSDHLAWLERHCPESFAA